MLSNANIFPEQSPLSVQTSKSPTFSILSSSQHASLQSQAPRLFKGLSPTLIAASQPKFSTFDFSSQRFYRMRALALTQNFANVHSLILTFPGTSPAALSTSCNIAALAMKAFLDELRKWNNKKAVSYLYGFERKTGSANLHTHVLLAVPSGTKSKFTESALRALWFDILKELSRYTQVNLFESEDGLDWSSTPDHLQIQLKPITKPTWAASYTIKPTCIKTEVDVKCPYVNSDGEVFTPAHWSKCSRNLKSIVAQKTIRLRFPVRSWEHGKLIISGELIPIIESLAKRQLIWKDHVNRYYALVTGQRSWLSCKMSRRKFGELRHKLAKLADWRRIQFPDHLHNSLICQIEIDSDGRVCFRLAFKKSSKNKSLPVKRKE